MKRVLIGLALLSLLAVIGWQYQSMPMKKCAWCGRTNNLNRHHLIAQQFEPELRDVQTNLVVLCRDCHFVLGHRCDWKTYNPDLSAILCTYTNTVRKIEAEGDAK